MKEEGGREAKSYKEGIMRGETKASEYDECGDIRGFTLCLSYYSMQISKGWFVIGNLFQVMQQTL